MVGEAGNELLAPRRRTRVGAWLSLHADRAMVAALAGLFAFTIIKAASTDITYDEGYSFLFYGQSPLGWAKLNLANDHPLNSLLIFLSTRTFGTSELVVRLPNILAGGLYYLSCATLIRSTRLRLLSFSICALQIYFLDYFSLARGYGLAVALVQYGLVQHFWVGDGHRRYFLLLGAMLLASFSIFPTVMVLYATIAVHTWFAARGVPAAEGKLWTALRQDRISLAFLFLGLMPVAGLLWVSRGGLPLYSSKTDTFDTVFTGVASMYVSPRLAAYVAIAFVIALGTLVAAYRRHLCGRTVILLLTGVVALAPVYAASRILGRPLPTGRVLLPWLPLANLAVISLADDIAGAVSAARWQWLRLCSISLSAALALSFAADLHFDRTNDWWFYADFQPQLVQALVDRRCLPPDVAADYGAWLFYVRRWFPDPNTRLPQPCPNP